MFNKKISTATLIAEMDQNVRRMLKLIEEDADSFAKKDEMYHQKRPELMSLVDEFYRMYRSLSERYDHATGELRRNVPSDMQSQGSCISEVGSELPSACPSPDLRPSRRRSGYRAEGFDFWIPNSKEFGYREGDELSPLDYESESDAFSVVNDDDHVSRRKIYELEVELRSVKEKLRLHQEDNFECSSTGSRNGNVEAVRPDTMMAYEEELRDVKEKLWLSEEEVNKLRTQILAYESMNAPVNPQEDLDRMDSGLGVKNIEIEEVQEDRDGSGMEQKVQALEKKLRMVRYKLDGSEKEVESLREELKKTRSSELVLQDQLRTTKADATSLRGKLDRDEIEVLKLKEAINNADKRLSDENSQLHVEVAKLQKERAYLENSLKELDLRCQSLEQDLRRSLAGKAEIKTFPGIEIELLKTMVTEKAEEVEELTQSLSAITRNHNMLVAEKDKLSTKVKELTTYMSYKDDRIDAMCQHLHQLQTEHVKLMSKIEGERKISEELRSTANSRAKELVMKIKQQEEIIQDSSEDKREAIRQLHSSLEHYRVGYLRLRNVVVNNMKSPVTET